MAAREVLFGVRTDPEKVITISTKVSTDTKVGELKQKAADSCNLSKESLECIYCGVILEDDATVESIGLRNGSLIHMLKKEGSESLSVTESQSVRPISEDCIQQLASAFKSFNDTPVYRSALHRLSRRPEVIDNIISFSPGLHEDSVAIAMLQDPDLMAHFTDIDTVKRVAELHPLLIEAAQSIVAAVHEEAHNASSSTFNNSSANNSQPAAHSYSVDHISLEEEMARDMANFFSRQPAHLPVNNTLYLPNTFPVANAQGSLLADNPPSSTSSGSNQSVSNEVNSTGVVTSQMFMEAMRQVALASNLPTQFSSPAASLSPMLSTASPQVADLQIQLAQMHEMGLQDDTVNVQALQFTNGDVQAAIELVFGSFSDN